MEGKVKKARMIYFKGEGKPKRGWEQDRRRRRKKRRRRRSKKKGVRR